MVILRVEQSTTSNVAREESKQCSEAPAWEPEAL